MGTLEETSIMENNFKLNSIHFKISYPSEIDNLAQYFLRENYQGSGNINVSSNIKYVDSHDIPKNWRKYSNSIYVGSGSALYLFDESLSILFHESNNKLISTTIRINQKTKRHNYKRIFGLRRNTDLFHPALIQAMRHAILFPYFILMNTNHGANLSHGSAFYYNGKGFAVIGLDGIGKSSIVSSLNENNTDIITDNFVLYDHNYIYFVPDPLRVIDNNNCHSYGKLFKKIEVKYEKVNNAGLIYTYLGNEYFFTKQDGALLNYLNNLFAGFLPEFYDLNRYITVLKLCSNQYKALNIFQGSEVINLFECQRSDVADNQRMVQDVMAI